MEHGEWRDVMAAQAGSLAVWQQFGSSLAAVGLLTGAENGLVSWLRKQTGVAAQALRKGTALSTVLLWQGAGTTLL